MDSDSNVKPSKLPIQVSIGRDVVGLGIAVRHLVQSILLLIKWKSSAPKREILNERARLRNEAIRIENAAQMAKLAKQFGYSADEMKRLFRNRLS